MPLTQPTPVSTDYQRHNLAIAGTQSSMGRGTSSGSRRDDSMMMTNDDVVSPACRASHPAGAARGGSSVIITTSLRGVRLLYRKRGQSSAPHTSTLSVCLLSRAPSAAPSAHQSMYLAARCRTKRSTLSTITEDRRVIPDKHQTRRRSAFIDTMRAHRPFLAEDNYRLGHTERASCV